MCSINLLHEDATFLYPITTSGFFIYFEGVETEQWPEMSPQPAVTCSKLTIETPE